MHHTILFKNLHSNFVYIPCTTKLPFSDSASLLYPVLFLSQIKTSGQLLRQQNPWANARGYYLPLKPLPRSLSYTLCTHLESCLLHILYVYHHPQLNLISPLELAIRIAILIVNQTRNKIVVTTMYYLYQLFLKQEACSLERKIEMAYFSKTLIENGMCLLDARLLNGIPLQLRIDTGGLSVNYSALFKEAPTKCSLVN